MDLVWSKEREIGHDYLLMDLMITSKQHTISFGKLFTSSLGVRVCVFGKKENSGHFNA